VVPGGGCVEAAVSIYLENYATTLVNFSSSSLLFPFFDSDFNSCLGLS